MTHRQKEEIFIYSDVLGQLSKGGAAGGWVRRWGGGGGSVSADVASLDVGLAQECFRNGSTLFRWRFFFLKTDDKESAGEREERQRKRGKEEEERVDSC